MFFAVGEHQIPRFRSRKAKNSFRSRKPVPQSETGFAVATANCEFSQSAANLRSQDPPGTGQEWEARARLVASPRYAREADGHLPVHTDPARWWIII